MKTCKDCKQWLPMEAFNRNPAGAAGLNTYCKACSSARYKAWRAANSVAVKARKHAIYEANKAAILAQQRAYYDANRAAILARQKLPPELNRARVKAWAAANPDKRRAQIRRNAENLSDGYVKHLLTQKTALTRQGLPQALLDMKREQIQVRRLAKQLKKAIHESITDPDLLTDQHGGREDQR